MRRGLGRVAAFFLDVLLDDVGRLGGEIAAVFPGAARQLLFELRRDVMDKELFLRGIGVVCRHG